MITVYDWLARLTSQSKARRYTTRTVLLDSLEPRQLLTTVDPIPDADSMTVQAAQSIVLVVSSSDGSPALTSPSPDQPMGPLPLDESGSGEGYGWVQGSGAGTGFVPGSVLASADSINWGEDPLADDFEGEGSGYAPSAYSGSGEGGSSGSGGESSGSGFSDFGDGWGSASGSGSGGSSGSGSGGSSSSGSTPPDIQNFRWSLADGHYIFSGTVTDDQDPAGLTVYFGGLLSGQSCTVLENGTFSYTVDMVDPLGEVTSKVKDNDQLWSEEEMVYI